MDGKIFFNSDGKVIMRNGKVWFFKQCPCECEPKVLASKVVNGGSESKRCWDLRGYQDREIGTPFNRWRLIEVSDPRTCGGVLYNEGDIDECGKLVGLPDEFCSRYSYDGYMEIQQGCYDYDNSRWVWPCPENSSRRYS